MKIKRKIKEYGRNEGRERKNEAKSEKRVASKQWIANGAEKRQTGQTR